MKLVKRVCVGLIVLAAVPLWSQEGTNASGAPAATESLDNANNANASNNNNNDLMQTPQPVSGQVYPSVVGSAEHSNYLRGVVSVTSAYTDNALGGMSEYPVSDISTSIAPALFWNEATSRLHSTLMYAPGLTFYQRETERNAATRLP